MTAKLHELLAVENDLASQTDLMLKEAQTTFEKKADHFLGQVRSVTFFSDTRQQENSTDEKAMVTTVDDKLGYTLNFAAKYFDAILQKEATNQTASADLEVDGVTIATALPATFLLGMETRLKRLREVIAAVPTLNPAMVWAEDATAGEGVYRSQPQTQNKTEKQLKSKVLYEATPQHPAQIEKWTEDVAVAKIEVVHTSGMWTPAEKAEVMARVDKLLRAVKRARQRANTVDIVDVHAGKAMIDYILG